MSSPEAAVIALLEASAAYVALAGARTYDTRAPANTALPYVTFQMIDDPDDRHMTGRSRVRRARVQLDAWAASPAAARALMDAADPALTVTERRLVALLDVVQIVRLDTRSGDDGEATRLFRRSADYQISYYS